MRPNVVFGCHPSPLREKYSSSSASIWLLIRTICRRAWAIHRLRLRRRGWRSSSVSIACYPFGACPPKRQEPRPTPSRRRPGLGSPIELCQRVSCLAEESEAPEQPPRALHQVSPTFILR
jgi:hypothetical protein